MLSQFAGRRGGSDLCGGVLGGGDVGDEVRERGLAFVDRRRCPNGDHVALGIEQHGDVRQAGRGRIVHHGGQIGFGEHAERLEDERVRVAQERLSQSSSKNGQHVDSGDPPGAAVIRGRAALLGQKDSLPLSIAHAGPLAFVRGGARGLSVRRRFGYRCGHCRYSCA
jgi:hypothetical protein